MAASAPQHFRDAETVRRWTIALLMAGTLASLALAQWWPEAQVGAAMVLIATIGLQHGALDHILHAHMHGDPEGPLRQSFALPYIAAIGLAWVAFEWAPAWMLGVFLVLSAYHFGMSHLRVDAMRHSIHPTGAAGTTLGALVIAPLVLRPDALDVLATYGWNVSVGFGGAWLPLQLATVVSILLAGVLHLNWRTGWLPLSGVLLAWCVDDLLLAFALYFALGHAREAFFEEFQERQSVATEFRSLYVRSLPLTAAFALMASAVMWAAHTGMLAERAALSFLLAGTLPHIAVLEGWVTARLR
jgi:Brp/Blh family beta-carotene 15,15'-monooxygenase